MVILYITIGALIIAVVVYLLKPSKKVVSCGTLAEVEKQCNVLINGSPQISTLIVELRGSGDFIQFSKGSGLIDICLPLITERQRSLVPEFRSAFSKLGLIPTMSQGSDGANFIECTMTAEPSVVFNCAQEILVTVFNAKENARFKITLLLG